MNYTYPLNNVQFVTKIIIAYTGIPVFERVQQNKMTSNKIK